MGKLIFLCLAHLLTLAASAASASASAGSGKLPKLLQPRPKRLRFFWHDIDVGPNATSVVVARSSTTEASPTNFGVVRVMDDPLTVGPDDTSRVIGRAQGMYLSADQKVQGILMDMTFVFGGPRYRGSTLAVVGRNEALLPISEMPIVGGSRIFRFATGYIQASPHSRDPSAGKLTVEYNCFISYAVASPWFKRKPKT